MQYDIKKATERFLSNYVVVYSLEWIKKTYIEHNARFTSSDILLLIGEATDCMRYITQNANAVGESEWLTETTGNVNCATWSKTGKIGNAADKIGSFRNKKTRP